MMRLKPSTNSVAAGVKPRLKFQRIGPRLERWLMAAQWHSKAIDLFAFLLEPLWPAEQVPARIVAIETDADATHLWLRAAQRWAWPKPGQFVSVTLNSEGEQLQRCYSISGLDRKQDRVRLSVCAVEGGRVSSKLIPALAVGDVLQISPAGGQFVLPEKSAPLWLWGAGSGITPMLPLVKQALALGESVSVLYLCRGQKKALLQSEWQTLEAKYPQQLTIELWDTSARSRPTQQELQALLSKQADNSHGYICGSDGFRETALAAARASQIPASQLHVESFYSTTAAVDPQLESADVVAKVNLSDGREIAVRAGETILQAARAAGITMPSCCGQGVCRSCETRKISGAVKNIQTGLKQLREGEWILPCISMPLSDVELAV